MTKLRVHELAKELNKTNKEILDILKGKNIEVKSHMSSLEDSEVEAVKKAVSEGEKGASGAPKKKNIVQVFRRPSDP